MNAENGLEILKFIPHENHLKKKGCLAGQPFHCLTSELQAGVEIVALGEGTPHGGDDPALDDRRP